MAPRVRALGHRLGRRGDAAPCETRIGVDGGLNSSDVTRNGRKIRPPVPPTPPSAPVAEAQPLLSRKRQGFLPWQRQRQREARIQARVSGARRDFLSLQTLPPPPRAHPTPGAG